MAWYDFLYKKVQLDSTERILREDAARIYQGILAFEGKFMLTSRRLLYIPQRPWFWIPILSFPLNGLQVAKQGSNRLVISAENSQHSFTLPGGSGLRLYGLASKEPDRWIEAIETAQADFQP